MVTFDFCGSLWGIDWDTRQWTLAKLRKVENDDGEVELKKRSNITTYHRTLGSLFDKLYKRGMRVEHDPEDYDDLEELSKVVEKSRDEVIKCIKEAKQLIQVNFDFETEVVSPTYHDHK